MFTLSHRVTYLLTYLPTTTAAAAAAAAAATTTTMRCQAIIGSGPSYLSEQSLYTPSRAFRSSFVILAYSRYMASRWSAAATSPILHTRLVMEFGSFFLFSFCLLFLALTKLDTGNKQLREYLS